MLKGLDEPKLILQAATPDLAQRVFLPGKGEASAPSNAASSKSSNFLLDAFKVRNPGPAPLRSCSPHAMPSQCTFLHAGC